MNILFFTVHKGSKWNLFFFDQGLLFGLQQNDSNSDCRYDCDYNCSGLNHRVVSATALCFNFWLGGIVVRVVCIKVNVFVDRHATIERFCERSIDGFHERYVPQTNGLISGKCEFKSILAVVIDKTSVLIEGTLVDERW